MQQNGEYLIAASRETVWQALNDPEVLARCISGCEKFTRTGEDRYQAAVKARVGPVRATFRVDLSISDAHPPERYTLTGNVQGGPAGFGKGTAEVWLEEADGATRLRYALNAQPGGKLAQIGSRLIDGTLRKMGADFFARFSDLVKAEHHEHHDER